MGAFRSRVTGRHGMDGREKDALALLGIVAASVLMMWPYLFENAVFLGADSEVFFYPHWQYHVAHRWDLYSLMWNDAHGFGYPSGLVGYVLWADPLNVLLTSLPAAAYRTYAVRAMLGCALVGITTYLLSRGIGMVRPAALLSGVAFALSRRVVNSVFAQSATNDWVVLPLVLLCTYKGSRGDRRWFLGAAFGVAFAFTSSIAPHAVMMSFVAGLFALYLSVRRRDRGKTVLWLLAAGVCGVLLSLFLLLPALDIAGHTSRGAQYRFTDAPPYAIPYTVLSFLTPVLEQTNSTLFYAPGYAGLATLILAIEGLRRCRRATFRRFFVIVGGIGLFLFFLPYTPLIEIWARIPGTNLFGQTIRAMFLATFALAMLAGWGLHTALTDPKRVTLVERAWRFIRIPFALGVGGWVAWHFLAGRVLSAGYLGNHRTVAAMVQATSLGSGDMWVLAATIPIVVAVLALMRRGRLKGATAAAVIVVLVGVDLVVTARNAYNVRPGRGARDFTSRTAAFLSKDKDLFRIYAFNETDTSNSLFERLAPLSRADATTLYHDYRRETLSPNAGMTYGFQNAQFGTTAPLARCAAFFNFLNFSPPPDDGSAEKPLTRSVLAHLKMLSMTNVKYVTSPEALDHPNLVLRHETHIAFSKSGVEANVRCYENTQCLPRAYLVRGAAVHGFGEVLAAMDDPGFDPLETVILERAGGNAPQTDSLDIGEANVVEWTPSGVRIETDAPAQRYLFVSTMPFPGWAAQVDGEGREILPANMVGSAIQVPAGKHEVRLAYRPRKLVIGAAVSAVTLLVLLTAGLSGRLRRR